MVEWKPLLSGRSILKAMTLRFESLALDLRTKEVGLFGLYGGFATYSDSEGLTFHKRADVENWMVCMPMQVPQWMEGAGTPWSLMAIREM